VVSPYCHAFTDADPIRYQSTSFDGTPATYGRFIRDDCLGDGAAVCYAGVIPNIRAVNRHISTNLAMPSNNAIGNDALVTYTGTTSNDCLWPNDTIPREYDTLLFVRVALL
jgi:hypothetical protein